MAMLNNALGEITKEYEVEITFKDGQTMKLTLDDTYNWCLDKVGENGYVIFKNTSTNNVPLGNLGGIINMENMNGMKITKIYSRSR